MPIKVPVTQTGLEASIEAAGKRAGKNLKINLGSSAKSIEGLSQPLGRITGKADQFTKSMEAANARVLAFGASVGVLSSVTRGFQDLVRTTIDVEKRLTSINSILGANAKQLESFKKTIFDVAKNTEQSFGTVADAALELSRQGLKAEEVTRRLNDSLVLARLSGLGASEAVAGLTAAINSFNSSGITSAEVLNKLSAAAVSAAVSERDLIEGIKRSGSVAIQAGVSFDELVGVITAVQTKTARGGAVIGNSFKTIFTRIQSIDKLKTMQNLGVQITDVSGEILSGTKLIENLAKALSDVPDARRLQIAENLVGKFQVAPFLAILADYNDAQSKAIEITGISQRATTEAYERNKALNVTLSAAINGTVESVKELAETLGKIGVTDSLKGILSFFNNLVSGLQNILDGDGIGSKFAKGIVKGIGNVISGPGLAIFGAIIAKLTFDLAKFGVGSLNTFFGLNRAAKEQATLQGQIASTLLGNKSIQDQILAIENSTLSTEQKRAAQTKFFTTALNEQLAVMTRMQAIAARVTPGVMAGTRMSGRGAFGRGASGFVPNYNAIMGYGSEQGDINRGVGGAPSSAKPVSIPNFNFGGGRKGTMVANTSEYMVPNFAGSGGSAIFNQDMIASMGLPSGAKKVGAAGGFIPNYNKGKPAPLFATGTGGAKGKPVIDNRFAMIIPQKFAGTRTAIGTAKNKQKYQFNIFGIQPRNVKAKETDELKGQIKKYAINKAHEEALLITGGEPLRKKQDKLGNQGGIGSLAGSIFETAISGIVKSPEFDLGQTASFDFLGLNTIEKISRISPAMKNFPNLAFVEAKIRDNDADIRNSMADKMSRFTTGTKTLTRAGGQELRGAFKEKGVTQYKMGLDEVSRRVGVKFRSAGGYIPNFAAPLQEAIARESAAGLPVSQIRINQDASLRNSANPMGLAVTNTRDEPTGAIPNFAKGATPAQANDAMGGFVGKLLAVQIGFSALSGVLGQVTEQNKALSIGLVALNAAVTASLVAQSFGGFGRIGKGIGSLATGKVGMGAMALGTERLQRGMTMMKGAPGIRVPASSLTGPGFTRAGTAPIKGGQMVRFGGALTKAGGALLRFAGPVGAVTVAAIATSKAIDYFSGRTARAADQAEDLAKGAEQASKVLSGLKVSQEFKEQTEKRAKESSALEKEQLGLGLGVERRKSLGKDLAVGLIPVVGAVLMSNRLFKNQIGGNIKGSQDKVFEANFETAIANSIKEGMSTSFINQQRSAMEAARKERGGQFVEADINKFIASISTGDFDAQKIINATAEKLTKDQQREILQFGKIESDAKAVGRDLTDEEKKRRRLIRKSVVDAGVGVEGRDKIDLELLTAGVKQKVGTEGTELLKIDQVRADIAKQQLSTEINLAKIRATALSQTEILLQTDGTRRSLTGERKAELQGIVALQKLDNEINGKIADTLDKEISKMTQLTFDEKKQIELRKELQGLSLEEMADKEKVRSILQKVFDLDKQNEDVQKELNNLVQVGLLGLNKERKVRRDILRDNTTLTKQEEKRKEAQANRLRDLIRERKSASIDTKSGLDLAQQDIDRRRGLLNANPNLTDAQKAARELKLVQEESVIKNRRAEAEAVEEANRKIEEISKTIDERWVPALLQLRKTLGEQGAQGFGAMRSAIGSTTGLSFLTGMKPEDADKLRELNDVTLKGGQANIELTRKQTAANEELAKVARDNIDAFDSYSKLLSEFGKSLRQQAEQLKVDLLTTDDIRGNVTNQLTTNQRKGRNAFQQAVITGDARIKAAQDASFLAGSSAESRKIDRTLDLLREEEKIRQDIAKRQVDGTINQKQLEAAEQRLLEIEKQRLEVNNTLTAKLEDAFLFSEKDIQNKLTDSLVSGARQFADTLGDGMADAIAKGENLGDILKQAAADFFLQQAKSQFGAGLDRITSTLFRNSGGPVVGGSGARDDVPALLTGGEYVMRKSAVQKFGPRFMEALNSGQIPAFNRGGLFTPGTFGQGAMRGKRSLLDFATQSFTTGAMDTISGGAGFASIALEPQSAALTMFGRRNSPQFLQEQASKNKAFDLYKRQIDKEKQARESSSGLSSILKNSLLAFGVGSLFNMGTAGLGGKGSAPRGIPVNPDGTDMNFLQRLMLPFKKATGGAIPYAAGIDTVPTMLSGGEFVMNAAATQRVGRGTLSSINSGGGGGGNGEVIGRLDELISVSEDSGETTINITVNSDGTSSEGGNGNEEETNLATRIRDVVKQVIDDEKRLGGSLRQARA